MLGNLMNAIHVVQTVKHVTEGTVSIKVGGQPWRALTKEQIRLRDCMAVGLHERETCSPRNDLSITTDKDHP
jgi:hypothetical protein